MSPFVLQLLPVVFTHSNGLPYVQASVSLQVRAGVRSENEGREQCQRSG